MTFEYFNFTHGHHQPVSLAVETSLDRAIQSAIAGSFLHVEPGAIMGTNFLLFADLSHGFDGYGHFFISAAPTCTTAPTGALFYHGAVATELATAPLAWRTLVTAYFPIVAGSSVNATFGAPAGMPRQLPWLCGFHTMRATRLTQQERQQLSEIVCYAGARLILRGQAATAIKRRGGASFIPQPDLFWELEED